MLHKSQITNPSAIQKLFCEPFELLVPTQELQREQDKVTAELFMTAGSLPFDMDTDPKHESRLKELKEIFAFAHTESCFKTNQFTYTLDFRSRFFISLLCEQLHKHYQDCFLVYLQYVSWKNHKKHIDFLYLCEKVFPFGTPLVKDLVELYKETCVDTKHCEEPNGRSILLYPQAMDSIMTISPEKVQPPKKDDDWDVMNAMKRFK